MEVERSSYRLENVKVFLVKERIRLHNDILFQPLFHINQRYKLAALEDLGDIRVYPNRYFLALQEMSHLPKFRLDLVAHRFRRLHPTRARTMTAWGTDCAL